MRSAASDNVAQGPQGGVAMYHDVYPTISRLQAPVYLNAPTWHYKNLLGTVSAETMYRKNRQLVTDQPNEVVITDLILEV